MSKQTKKPQSHSSSRRKFLKGTTALVGTAALGFPAIHARAAKSLKVGTYGGYFKDSFDKHIYPDFTKETGVTIESVAEPTGEAWLVQLQTAAGAGVAPADVSMMAQVPRLKGQKSRLWAALDESKLSNAKFLLPHFVHRYPDGARQQHRGGVLVHHPGDQYQGLPAGADVVGRALGFAQQESVRASCVG